ncbi:hypothetical protein KUF83_30340 [Streptomyces sp. BV286]|uniref:hypothetical protein n=1 Tax=Streptomyces sp. BV286 TaxID=2849672 RepID=UPI001C2DFC9A|nr:hypothetical protein [Streptomyces sp. BV286]MBV1940836.1 hypothetical protein [Streptomyces sp. BV286]
MQPDNMTPAVKAALQEWKDAYDHQQQCAINALCTALPGLDRSPTPPYCCPVTLAIDKPRDLGDGRICIDDDTRATVELDSVPNELIIEAVQAVFDAAWFDMEDAEPGTYNYDDETTGGEYEVVLGKGDNPLGRVYVGYVHVPYAVEVLDALNTARQRQQQRQAAGVVA